MTLASFGDFDGALWEYPSDAAETLEYQVLLARLLRKTDASLTAWTLVLDLDDAREDARLEDALAVAIRARESRWVGNTRLHRIYDPRGDFIVIVLPSPYDGVVNIASAVPGSDERWKRLRRQVLRSRDVTPIVVNPGDFAALGDQLSEFGRVEASRLTARDIYNGSSFSRGWPLRSQRVRPSHREALREVAKMSVQSLTLTVGGGHLRVNLRREAGATFYSGDFPLFCNVVLAQLARLAEDRRLLLSERQRRQGKPAPTPLTIEFPHHALGSAESHSALLRFLGSRSQVSVAVYHRNPYLHFAVTDYRDGSNCDVFVTDASSCTIIPGYRATLAALTRLTDNIAEHFGAEQILEAVPPPPLTLEELIAPDGDHAR